MNRIYTNLSLVLCLVLTSSIVFAQQDWPKTITTAGGDKIKVYQPQPESFSNNILKSRSAVSVITAGKTDPVFGVFWSVSETALNSDGKTVHVQSVQVTDVKFPADIDNDKAAELKTSLQTELGRMSIDLQKSELDNALNLNQQETKLAGNLNNNPPKVMYTSKPSTLVLIDGTPKLQMNNEWGVEVVVNTPFTMVKNTDGKFYLYGAKKWYSAPAATGPYTYNSNVPDNLTKVETAVNSAAQSNTSNNTDNAVPDNVIPEIIVSTEPAELIQSNGEADLASVEGTNLLYVKNSSNDIFMDVNSQQYYVLLSGRWYKASSLTGQWQYTASNKLPADFAKIPEGSSKDNVLASVAGTEAADDAVMNAQVPQTAKVDRSTATANVTYDGDPEFARIDGTRLQYAVNASGTVLRYDGRYYAVDNGVWFESARATGPWVVSTERPGEVELIPPSYPVYNVKYVYIYDVTPDYVYMGYTPGYLNTFIYGPTIVYGTGYYYRPWYGRYYYPRPYTWGFSVGYTPWYGWGIGFNYSYGWLNVGFGRSSWNYWNGGWWGGSVAYRPAFCGSPYRSYGYYGNRVYPYARNNYNININYTNNIYRSRGGVVTHDNRAWYGGNGRSNFYANNNNHRDAPGGRYNGNNSYNNRFDRNRFNSNGNNNNDHNRFNNRSNNNGNNNNDHNRFSDRNNNRFNNDPNRFNGNGGNNNNPDRNRFNNRSNNNGNSNGITPYTPGRPQQSDGGRMTNRNNNSDGGGQGQQQQRREQRSFNNDRPVFSQPNRDVQRSQPQQQRSFTPSQPRSSSGGERSPGFHGGGDRGGQQQSNGGGNRGGNDGGGRSGGNGGGHGRRG